MPQVISEYTPVFNEVVSDLLANWDNKLQMSPNAKNNGLLITDLEKELYNWSIECEYCSSLFLKLIGDVKVLGRGI